MDRRLAAILAADVVGFSRLIRDDEDGAIQTMQRLHATVRPVIEEQGRLIDAAGDSLLAEFPSTEAAVRVAVTLQELMPALNSDRGGRPLD